MIRVASKSIELGSACRSVHRWQQAVVLTAAALLVESGCGPRVPHSDRPWAQANVTVRVGADPLTTGEVAFLAGPDSTGIDAGGVVDAKGTITFPVLPGDYTVVIRPLPPSEEEMAKPRTGPNAAQPRATSIPVRFHSPKTSPLKVTLSAREKRAFTFDLSSSDGK